MLMSMTQAISDKRAWERPGAHQVAPGVFRIPLPLPGDHLHAVNVYAIADGDRLVMIDGGMAVDGTQPVLDRALADIGYRIGDVSEFLVTHMHRDHYTQAVAVRRRFGTRVSLGEGERAAIEACRTLRPPLHVKGLVEAGAEHLLGVVQDWPDDPDVYEEPDRWLPDGLDIPLETRTLRVIATPGHTRGHVVFHDPAAGVLFAGDHVLPHITPSIGFELPRSEYPRSPLRDFLDSLRIVQALPDATLLPAHGPTGGSTHARAGELIAFHQQRFREMAGALTRGASTAYDAARTLGWTRRNTPLERLDPMNQMLAIFETATHLDLLAERGAVRRWVDGSVDRPVVRYELLEAAP